MLTTTVDIPTVDFIKKIHEISRTGIIMIAYTFDIEIQELTIVASGTLFLEPKLIHGASYVGHIEDIVVHEAYRQHGIAKAIMQRLTEYAVQKNCYKIILDCAIELEPFYERLGFEKRGTQMAKYFTQS
jgi:glucosamine-phosphate N-acetyltransferase